MATRSKGLGNGLQVILPQTDKMSAVQIKEQGGGRRLRGPKSSSTVSPLLLSLSPSLPGCPSLTSRNIFLKHKTALLKASRWLLILTELPT